MPLAQLLISFDSIETPLARDVRPRAQGAKTVTCLASHGLFVGPAYERLGEAKPDEVIVSDTVPIPQPVPENVPLTVLSAANLLSEAITRIHRGKSVSVLFV